MNLPRGLLAFIAFTPLVANAQPQRIETPRLSLGGGLGAPQLLHVDASIWVRPAFTVDVDAGGLSAGWARVSLASVRATMHLTSASAEKLGWRGLASIGAAYVDIGSLGDEGGEAEAGIGAIGLAGGGYLGQSLDVRLLAGGYYFGGSKDGPLAPIITASAAWVLR